MWPLQTAARVGSLPTTRLTRRRFLGALIGVGVLWGASLALRGRAADSDVEVAFEDCQTAVVTNATTVETLSVYYSRHSGTRLAQYDVPATETELYAYRPLVVRHSAVPNRTTVRLAARGSIVCVIAERVTGNRTAVTNDRAACVPSGFNSPPTATFTAATATRSASEGETLVVYPGEDVTLSSTATDPDLPVDRLRSEWDVDGDGRYETTGSQVTTTYPEAGTAVVGHRATDDFDATSVSTLTVDVRTPWTLREKLTPPDLGVGDQFGIEVVVSDEYLVTSGPGDDDRGPNAGAAYVYQLGDLSQPPTKLTPATLHSGDLAGISIAVSGERLMISAVCDDERGDDAGAVYVYDLTDLSRPPTRLAPTALRPHDFLGLSLAALDDTLVAGAHLDDERADYAGALFVFDLADVEAPPTKVAPAELGERDLFGMSVAVTDEWVIGGAVGDDEKGAQAGAVYVYDRSDLSRQPTKLAPDGLAPGDQFGRPLAAAGETLVVGTAFDDDRGLQAGAVYVYDLTDLSRPPTKLAPDNLSAGDLFGYAVALSRGRLAVGAIGDDTTSPDGGAVYVYDRSDLTRPPDKLVTESLVSGDLFGFSVGVADDTLAAGAVFDDECGWDAGAVYVFER